MNKNDICEVLIEDMSETGEGIGKHNGYTLFVKDAVPGDRISAKITKAKKHYAFARTERIIEASPYRVEPACPVSRACGGCQLQSLAYEKQLEFKSNKVENCLRRIGGFDNVPMEPIIGMDSPYRYRNKSQYPLGYDRIGHIISGFYAGRTHSIIEHDDCILSDPINETILGIIKSYMSANAVSAYDEGTGTGELRHVLLRRGYHTGEIMVCLVSNVEKLANTSLLVEKLMRVNGMTSICLNINKNNTNVILGEHTEVLWGSRKIHDCIGNLTFAISAESFFQVNSLQTERLYEKVLEYAAPAADESVWDLYCGAGTISLFLAQKAGRVFGVEVVEKAVEDARENAQANGLENVTFYAGYAEQVVPELIKSEHLSADIVVVDPPRKGCDEALLSAIIQTAPKRVVYVSCDPATLARDCRFLCDKGYEIIKVNPVDMFPQGVHVETVVLMSKKSL